MAVKRIPVPFCDVCGKPWLPKHRLADGTVNPVFEKPEKSKRCGKCKSTRWNAAGVDRRRKAVIESPAEIEQQIVEVQMPKIPEEVFQYAESMMKGAQILSGAQVLGNARCRHGLYSCPECHPQEAV